MSARSPANVRPVTCEGREPVGASGPCRTRSRPVCGLWRSRPSVRRVVRPDVRRVLCRLPCALCRAGCPAQHRAAQPFAASVSCRRTIGATSSGATVRPITRRVPSGLSPVKGVNLSARPARADNSPRANVRPVARSVRPDLRRRRNRSACAVHVRGTFAACGVRACPSGALPVPTCGASCAACRAPCAVRRTTGATVRRVGSCRAG